jgi:single-stranded DNA-binding protein
MSGIEAAFFGALGRDAEAKTSRNGKPYLRLNIRVGDGDAAQWVSVMAFDEQALAAADKMVKGTRVYVEGTLRLDEWTAADGTKRHSLNVMSWHCRLAAIGRNRPKRARDRPNVSVAGGTIKSRAPAAGDFNDEIPF